MSIRVCLANVAQVIAQKVLKIICPAFIVFITENLRRLMIMAKMHMTIGILQLWYVQNAVIIARVVKKFAVCIDRSPNSVS